MQRITAALVALGVGVGHGAAGAQEATGLWRVAATTLPIPPALALGSAAAFWNPAQIEDSARAQVAIEGVGTPAAVGASGILAVLRVRAGALGYVGLVYGRVGLTDLTRTGDSPDPVGSVPVYTSAMGVTWSRAVGRTALGATLRYHVTRLDAAQWTRATFDVGASREVLPGLRLAAATHFLGSLATDNAAQDVYAGIECRLWRGPLWGDDAVVRGRYGLAFARGFAADHQAGLGFELGAVVSVDAGLVREGGYADGGWRPAAGLRVAIGKYRVTMARDAGVNDVGSAYRVGVEARFP
jgi:hypothetical protein